MDGASVSEGFEDELAKGGKKRGFGLDLDAAERMEKQSSRRYSSKERTKAKDGQGEGRREEGKEESLELDSPLRLGFADRASNPSSLDY